MFVCYYQGAAIWKLVKLPYFNEKLSDFNEIWYTNADLEYDDVT